MICQSITHLVESDNNYMHKSSTRKYILNVLARIIYVNPRFVIYRKIDYGVDLLCRGGNIVALPQFPGYHCPILNAVRKI